MSRVTSGARAGDGEGDASDGGADDRVGVARGTALFVAAIVGPGILTLPALAAAEAGPASLIALGLLLAVSAPIAFTFAALSAAVPGANGIAGYAAAAFGPLAGQLVSAWFRYGVPVGIPALGLIGGEYVAEATGGGRTTVVTVAAAICLIAVVVNIRRRAGSGVLTLALALLLFGLITATALIALPHAQTDNLTPFAPRGFLAIASSALLLTWVLTGWEAVTNFTHVLRDPRRTLPRVTTATLVIVMLLYAAVAIPELLVLGPTAGGSEAPVAAMLRIAAGPTGAIVAALVAVVVAAGNTIAWVGSLAELGTRTPARADRRGRPTTDRNRARTTRANTLAVPGLIMTASLAAVAFTPVTTGQLVALCAGSQVPLYIVGLAAGLRLLPAFARDWWLATVATAAVTALLFAAGIYLLVPALIALCVTARHLSEPGTRKTAHVTEA
jgi:amino acid efflux transporter